MPIFSFSTPVCATEPAIGQRYQPTGLWTRPLIGMGLAGLVIGFLFQSTASSMVSIWYGSNTYSYGFVVVPICAFLAWRCRSQLHNLRPTSSFAGLASFVLFAAIWMVGNVADVQLVQQFAFIGLIGALVWTFLGTETVHVLAFALLFLFFSVPAGESLVGPLQRLTAVFTVNAVRLSGIPAVQDGFMLSTPTGDWKIAEACSGIRYLTASIVVGFLVAGVAFRSWKRRIGFILLSALVPILANAVRAYLIVVLAYLSNNRIAVGVDHVIYGWIFFSVVTATLIGIALGWREAEVSPVLPAESPMSLPQASIGIARLVGWVAIVILIVVLATSAADFLWSRSPAKQPGARLWSPPAGWVTILTPDDNWAPNLSTIDAATFKDGSREVDLYAASYPVRRRGVELVNSYNAVGAGGEWDLLNNDYRQTTIGGKSVRVAEYLLAHGGQRRLVWMWYLTGDELTANPYRIKLMQAESRLAGHPESVTLFAISTTFNSQPFQAVEDLSAFARGMSFPVLTGCLR